MTDLSESSALRTFSPKGRSIRETRPEYAQHSSILVSSMNTWVSIIIARTTSNNRFPVLSPSCTASFPYAACFSANDMVLSFAIGLSVHRARVLRS